MNETIKVNKYLSEEETYKSLLPQIEALIDPERTVDIKLCKCYCCPKEAFDKISWVGFYFVKDNKLFLGPFQGKVACTVIEIGKGVCGNAVSRSETIIVDDVERFPGHIACDSGSRSEIVIPLIKDDMVFGVLDLDSYQLSAFDYIRSEVFGKICKLISNFYKNLVISKFQNQIAFK